jgi:hypothetical protein
VGEGVGEEADGLAGADGEPGGGDDVGGFGEGGDRDAGGGVEECGAVGRAGDEVELVVDEGGWAEGGFELGVEELLEADLGFGRLVGEEFLEGGEDGWAVAGEFGEGLGAGLFIWV